MYLDPLKGGGRSSARETIERVAAVAVAKKFLKIYAGTEVFVKMGIDICVLLCCYYMLFFEIKSVIMHETLCCLIVVLILLLHQVTNRKRK